MCGYENKRLVKKDLYFIFGFIAKFLKKTLMGAGWFTLATHLNVVTCDFLPQGSGVRTLEKPTASTQTNNELIMPIGRRHHTSSSSSST